MLILLSVTSSTMNHTEVNHIKVDVCYSLNYSYLGSLNLQYCNRPLWVFLGLHCKEL